MVIQKARSQGQVRTDPTSSQAKGAAQKRHVNLTVQVLQHLTWVVFSAFSPGNLPLVPEEPTWWGRGAG